MVRGLRTRDPANQATLRAQAESASSSDHESDQEYAPEGEAQTQSGTAANDSDDADMAKKRRKDLTEEEQLEEDVGSVPNDIRTVYKKMTGKMAKAFDKCRRYLENKRGMKTPLTDMINSLPKPLYDKYWSQADEHELNTSWQDEPLSRSLNIKESANKDLIPLWRVHYDVLHAFPTDFVGPATYIEFGDKVELEGQQRENPNWSTTFCEYLKRLPLHPLFMRSRDLVVVAMQYTVICRTNDRRRWPLEVAFKDDFFREFMRTIEAQDTSMSIRSLHRQVRHNLREKDRPLSPHAKLWVQLFRRIEQKMYQRSEPLWAFGEGEVPFEPYRITSDDMRKLIDALDHLHSFGAPVFPPLEETSALLLAARRHKRPPANIPELNQLRVPLIKDQIRTRKIQKRYAKGLREFEHSNELQQLAEEAEEPLPDLSETGTADYDPFALSDEDDQTTVGQARTPSKSGPVRPIVETEEEGMHFQDEGSPHLAARPVAPLLGTATPATSQDADKSKSGGHGKPEENDGAEDVKMADASKAAKGQEKPSEDSVMQDASNTYQGEAAPSNDAEMQDASKNGEVEEPRINLPTPAQSASTYNIVKFSKNATRTRMKRRDKESEEDEVAPEHETDDFFVSKLRSIPDSTHSGVNADEYRNRDTVTKLIELRMGDFTTLAYKDREQQ
ncbi:hypothetical protein SUNI508_06021 [Seiridium unicorne]|uniref:Uncharacterized protein n=1 Tax=Seiridium unicorne TaxID=138068 RepID=A0ABR2V2M7_9PEZI